MNKKIGCDLVDAMPDYTKSKEENELIYRERYFKVYEVYPDDSDGQIEDSCGSDSDKKAHKTF
ncbi:hypothetical protein Desca_0647 [Desulfotomaculum nigrificans CO-1-SRB]|uniref:Uncharacterized protein n=1 Tax=Desulfotomaculum nigrificans (strain DSM 14880 / VKM B-2319 / CO-1-SRB) TaxID=868595 RepID=F6B889_DESCC|nr:hypothetical protein [Desulfotomaculum nigrificans]AEF93534.1 hypothetical protein Desca_0647 [Desulfotomaculum nigrificans CO-1-SRB]